MDSGSFGKQYKGEDIISRMPDDVLSHIISRLEAKDVVKTSILSTRWKNVWTLIYNLCFRDGYGGNRVTLFVNFVEFVFHRCQSNNIQNFHLWTCYELQESDAARLTDLICFAVERNVCSLTLKFIVEGEYPMIRLPQSMLTCKSLVKLSLGFWDFVLDIPDGVVCFPCLKFLSFHVYCPNSNLMQKLFRSCPILEELKIKGVYGWDGNVWTFDITKPTLKKLKIDLRATGDDDIILHRFVVRAPNLEYLHVCNFFLVCSVLGETPFLNKVILDGKVDRRLLHGDSLTKPVSEFFRAINSTRFLRLDIEIMSVSLISFNIFVMFILISHDLYGNLPSFPNLIYLHLGVGVFIGYALLVQFLDNSPNLEVLVLDKEDADSYSWDEIVSFEFELECVPSCMLLHLKEIYLFFGEDRNLQDLDVMKCLLENSKVLERFSVNFYLSLEEQVQNLQNFILTFPRASPICEIDFFDDPCWGKLRSKFYKYR
ncbi:hypothetical protein EZV62_026354 [Acer yangbiense]|uniref:F-box domain-containing protein n=1 Tax=Acer yangbiense TaxID=1000413 RepID=A0A5C7GRB8_9ROSI|nr:hypothetical protein EZV62_026354 [Acer yangbiense]